MRQIILFWVMALYLGLAQAAGLQVKTLQEGSGPVAEPGDIVSVHYTGWLLDGKKFDSSRDRGQPIQFELGAGRVIPGWEQGVAGMRVGEQRELIIPPELAYGNRDVGNGLIPANSTLKFEVELVAAEKPRYTNIDNAELKKLLDQGVKIYDIRREDEWKQTGVVKGSRKLTLFDARGGQNPAFFDTFTKEVKPDEPVILICRTGNRTSMLARFLAGKGGYRKVYNVKDGIVKWIADGNPVVKD